MAADKPKAAKCQHCGQRFAHAGRGRPRRFCSDACRQYAFRARTQEPHLSVPSWVLEALGARLSRSDDKATRELARLLVRGDVRGLGRALKK